MFPLIFLGIALLIHAGVSYSLALQDRWLYSTVQGVQTRTDKQTGVRYISTSTGWMTMAQRQAELDENRKRIEAKSYRLGSGY